MIDCIWTQEISTEGCGFSKLKQFNICQGHGIYFFSKLFHFYFYLIRVENQLKEEKNKLEIDRKLSLLQTKTLST